MLAGLTELTHLRPFNELPQLLLCPQVFYAVHKFGVFAVAAVVQGTQLDTVFRKFLGQ
jgi:hypothetical protein